MSTATPPLETNAPAPAAAVAEAAAASGLPNHAPVVTYPTLITAAATIAALYFGRDVFLPLAVAVLLTFALAPLVFLDAQARLPRPVAVGHRRGGARLRRHHPVRRRGGHSNSVAWRRTAALSVEHRMQGAPVRNANVGQGVVDQCRACSSASAVKSAATSGRQAIRWRHASQRPGGASAAGRGGRAGAAAAAGAAHHRRRR